MKIYKNKITYEIEFTSTQKPEIYNIEEVKNKIKLALKYYNFAIGQDKLTLDYQKVEI